MTPAPAPEAAGLTSTDAQRLLAEVGPNRLAEPPRRSAWRRFTDQLRSVLVLILAIAAGVAALLGDFKDAVVVAVVLLINAVLGFVQEGRAESAMAALREMLVVQARVRRDDRIREVPAEDLVPGDVVLLEAGDRVPADGRFLTTISLAVDESSLTGESVPVDKQVQPAVEGDDPRPIGERTGDGFLNTTVVRGRAELLVERTGMATEMGQVAELMQAAGPETSPLQVQLDQLGKRLAAVAVVAVGLVFLLGLLQGEELADALIGAVALAIAAIPEGLPAVVTVTLAVGVHQMALRNAIVKRLASVETLGSTTVICSDKTGTLTMNEMTADQVVLAAVPHDAHDASVQLDPEPGPASTTLLDAAVLCSDASFDDGTLVGDPTEGALLALAAEHGVDVDERRRARPRIGEVPFDSATKRMATFHRDGDDVVCLVKGAPDVVLDLATTEVAGTESRPLDADRRRAWEDANAELARLGERVLAMASRHVPAAEALDADGEVVDAERWVADLQLVGLVGIVDPPRPEAREAIARCRTAGVSVKMITGDHAATAASIAHDLGIEGTAITGADLDARSDEQLEEEVEDIGVFARVSPEHKVRVIRALKARGHVVAMTGDGVNDAAALRHADIGVAMGITGTEVTKQAADMVLADDQLPTIVGAVERGRAIYDNIVTFVRFQLTTNLGAIGTFLAAGLLGLPTPLSAIQVLFVNIIADGPPAMTLGVDPPRAGTMTRPPRPTEAPILSGERLRRLLPPAAAMVVGTLGVLTLADDRWSRDVALTMTFTTFVLFQLVNVFNARTERESVLSRQSLRNRKLWLAVGSVAALQVAIVAWGPMQRLFDTRALSVGQWATCVGVALSVLVVEEVRKAILRRR